MARTFVRQATQIRKSDLYNDQIAPSETAYQTGSVSIEDDLNSLRSQIQNFINRNGASFPTGNWYDDLSAPGTFEFGTQRGINTLNSELHALERKRVLTQFASLADVFVSASNNFTVLAAGELPQPGIPNPTAVAVGVSTVTGSVAASGSIGTFSLNEVAGATAISPKNLCTIVSGSSRDPLLSDGRVIYALFQSDKTDGQLLTGGDAQLSFVRVTASGDDLEAVPSGDIAGKTINYISVTRKALEDLSEQDFLRGAEIDVPSAAATITRQNSYDNQGATPVELANNAILDLNAAGISWEIRDLANAPLFTVTEGSTGGTSAVTVQSDVDTLQVNAAVVNVTNGLTANSSLEIGLTAGEIVTNSGVNLHLHAAGALYFDDGNKGGSTWMSADGISLSDNATEWTNFKTNFGEVSLLSAISTAYNTDRRSKTYANVISDVGSDTDVSLADGNLDAALPAMVSGSFTNDYDVYLNGELLRPGANSLANNDYYPGSNLNTGAKLKFEFSLKTGDVICVVASNSLLV